MSQTTKETQTFLNLVKPESDLTTKSQLVLVSCTAMEVAAGVGGGASADAAVLAAGCVGDSWGICIWRDQHPTRARKASAGCQ